MPSNKVMQKFLISYRMPVSSEDRKIGTLMFDHNNYFHYAYLIVTDTCDLERMSVQ